MICPECGLETRVGACWVEVSGDDRPDTVTRVVRVQQLLCRNPRCPKKDREVGQARCVLYPPEEAQ